MADSTMASQESAADKLVQVQDLRVHFRTGKGLETVKAVDGVDFDVRAGETFGVIGESGTALDEAVARPLAGLHSAAWRPRGLWSRASR